MSEKKNKTKYIFVTGGVVSSLGKGLIFKSGIGAAHVAVTPIGPVPFGKLVFPANGRIVEKDGVLTFADIHQADGALVPVSIRIRQEQSAPE